MEQLNKKKPYVLLTIMSLLLANSLTIAGDSKKNMGNKFSQNGLLSQLCVIQDYENKRTSSTDSQL